MHTHILSPLVQWHTTATFLTNHLFKSKYLKQFFAQIQKLQKKCAKKRKHLQLCLLKGCFKTHTPHPPRLAAPYLWGVLAAQFHVASMLKYTHILKAQSHPCLSSVTWSILEKNMVKDCFDLPWVFITQFSSKPESELSNRAELSNMRWYIQEINRKNPIGRKL